MGSFTSLRDVISALLRRFWLIVLICAVGFPLSVWFALSQPRVYEATAVIQIETPQVVETLDGGAAPTLTADSQLDLIQQKMMSRSNIEEVIEKFMLFPGDIPQVERVALLRGAVQIVKLIDPALAWRTDVQPSGLSITVRLGDATESAAVANEFLDRIIAEAQRRTEGRASLTFEFFAAEEARVSAEIAAVDDRLTRFKEQNADSLPTTLPSQRTALARFEEQRMEVEQAILQLEADSGRLRATDVARQTELLQQQLILIDANIARAQGAIDAGPEVERQLTAINREIEALQDEYAVITARRTEAAVNREIELRDQAERFEVLETAIVPQFPVSASRKKLALAGGVATAGIAVLLALALEMMSGKIRTAAQLERQLGVRPVIVVPTLTSPGRRRARMAAVMMILAALAAAAAWIWSQTRGGGGGGALPAE